MLSQKNLAGLPAFIFRDFRLQWPLAGDLGLPHCGGHLGEGQWRTGR